MSAVADTAHHRRCSFPTFTCRGRGPPTHTNHRALLTFCGCRHRRRRHSAAVCQTDAQAASHHSQSPRTSEVPTQAPLPARLSRTYRYPPQTSQNRLLSFLRNEHAADRRAVEMPFFLLNLHEGTLFARLQLHADVTRIPLAGASCPSRACIQRQRQHNVTACQTHTKKRATPLAEPSYIRGRTTSSNTGTVFSHLQVPPPDGSEAPFILSEKLTCCRKTQCGDAAFLVALVDVGGGRRGCC